MTNIETRLGLTNIVKRLAYFYLLKGVGVYPVENAWFDEVKVEEFNPWQPNILDPEEYGAGIRVSFYCEGHRVRFVEFSLRCAGGGGDEAVKLIK